MEDDMEQRIHDLENTQTSLQSQLTTEKGRTTKLEASETDLKSRLDRALADLEREKVARAAVKDKADKASKAWEEREAAVRRVDELTREAKEQQDRYDDRVRDIEKLRAELRGAERDCEDAKDEVEAKSREVVSLTRRASSLQTQCVDIEKELDERTKALAEYRGQKSQELVQTMRQVAEANERADDQEAKAAAALRTVDGLRTRLARTEGDLKAVAEKSATDKAGLEKQISLQETLTKLQREKADEAGKKVESLQREIRSLQGQVASERDRTVQERQRADSVRDRSKAVVEELRAKLVEKEAEVKRASDSAGATPHSKFSNGDPMEAEPVPLDAVDLDTLNDTELKMRLMRMERELEFVRSDRDRNELYLTRILREVDQKSPLLMSNKKDYQRVLQSHEQLFLKVEDSMRRCQRAEMERDEAASMRDLLEQQLETAKDSLADLGAQVQKLLRDRLERDLGRPLERSSDRSVNAATGETAIVPKGNVVPQDPEQVIADHLVTFEDVRQMQERNRMLVQVTRRLTAELKDTKIARTNEKASMEDRLVEELQRQVDELKRSRERQNEMLSTVKNARDMYRLLLAQETNKDMASSTSDNGGGSMGSSSAAAAQELEAMKSRVHELERDLGVSREEAGKLQQSLRLMGEEVTTAERAQSKAKADLAAVQRMLSHSEDQVKVLTEDRSARNRTIELGAEKFQRLSDNVVKLQDHLEKQKNEALAAQNEAKDMSLTNQALRADKRLIESSEKQLREENTNLRKENRSKEHLLEQLTETGRNIGALKIAEISSLTEQKDQARGEAEKERRARAGAEMCQQKAEADLRELRRELERKEASLKAEAESARKSADEAQQSEKLAATRAVELAARLQEARARLVTGSGGAGGGDEGMSAPLAEVGKLQMELQSAKAELKAKTEACATNERQRVQYEAIAKSKQQQLDQLTAASEKVREELEAREKAALAKVEASEAEVRATKTGLASTVADLVKEKETAEANSLTNRQLIVTLRDELESSKSDAEQERGRTADVKKELEIQQKAARASEERYRQELEAHAGAITALRQAEDAQDECKKAQREAEHAKDVLAADVVRARAEWKAQEGLLKQACEDAQERLASVNSQNEVLHSHLQNLTKQMEAEQESRQKEERAVAARVEGEGASAAEGEGADGAAAGMDEKVRLARSVKELTELVRHKRRDVQVVTTNLEISKQRVSTLEAELERTKLSLRDAREEVQKAARDNVNAVSRAEHRKLLEEVAQVSTLRESNIMLRNTLRETEDRNRKAVARARELEHQAAPLHQAEKRHAAAAAALASDKDSLRKEVENWKKRVTSLTASFNAVDPKDHEDVVAEKDRLQKALAETRREKNALETSKAELMRVKATVEKQRDDAIALKSRVAAQMVELRKSLEGSRREAAAQKAAATRELESKLAAEKEASSKATSEALSAKQDAARARAGSSSMIKQLNDQVAKAKAEAETLRTQLRQAPSKDGGLQAEPLRKKIASLEEAILAKDRENQQNRNMYDNMKNVSRKIKENLENIQQEAKEKDEKIEKLQARIAVLEGQAAPPAQGVSPAAAVLAADAAARATSAAPGGGRPARSISPTPPGSRGLSPTTAARPALHASSAAMSDAPGAGGSGAAAGRLEGDDGGEASLRNRLMARAHQKVGKRPLAHTPESTGPSKRVHKPGEDEPTPSSTATSTPASTSPADAAVTTAATATTMTAPTFGSTTIPAAATGSSSMSFGASPSTSSSAAPAAHVSSFPATVPSTPGFGGGQTLDSSAAGSKSGANTSVFGSSSSLNPAARSFGFGAGGWGGPRRAVGSTSSTSALGAPAPAPAPAAPAPASSAGMFGGMAWGARRPGVAVTSPSSSAGTASTTSTTASAPATSTTPAVPIGGTAVGETAAGGAAGVAMKDQGGRGTDGKGGSDSGVSGGKAAAPAPGSVFGSGKGFAGFGGGAGFGSNVASMKPPSSGAAFSKFPSVQLPVPSSATGAKSSTATAFTPVPPTPGGATTFGIPSPGISTDGGSSQEQRPAFGSASGGQLKFGLSPSTSVTFGAAVPTFGRPAAVANTTATSSPTAAAAPATAVPPGTDVSPSDGSAAGGEQSAGGADVVPTTVPDSAAAAAAAAAGVPGPGALMLDIEARRAARERRFAAQGAGSTPGSKEATTNIASATPAAGAPAAAAVPATPAAASTSAGDTSPTSGGGEGNTAQAQQEDGEIDEEDEGDPL